MKLRTARQAGATLAANLGFGSNGFLSSSLACRPQLVHERMPSPSRPPSAWSDWGCGRFACRPAAARLELRLQINVLEMPAFRSAFQDITGMNGMAGARCSLLTSTSLGLPATNWTPLATNMFDLDGRV